MAALAKSSLAGSCCVDARDNPEAQAGEVRSGVRRPIARASVSDTQPWQPTLTSPLSMIQLNKTHRIPVVVFLFFVSVLVMPNACSNISATCTYTISRQTICHHA